MPCNPKLSCKIIRKKSEQYRGPRRSGWAGAVSDGQGQYWVGTGSIGCYTTKSQIFGILNNLCKMLFLLVEQKNWYSSM